MSTQGMASEADRCAVMMQEADAVIWQADAWASRFFFVSEHAVRVLGYPIAQWKTEKSFLQNHVPKEDWPALLGVLYRAALGEGPQTCEHRMIKVDGSILWVETTVHCYAQSGSARSVTERQKASNGAGEPVVLGGTTVDVTHLKDDELRLRESEAQHRAFFENAQRCGLFTVTDTGSVHTWPAGASRLHGYRPEEIVGHPVADLFEEGDAKRGIPNRLIERARYEGASEFDGLLTRKGKGPFWAKVTFNSMRDGGESGDISVIVLDRSERQALEEELRRTAQYYRLLVETPLEYAMFMLSVDGNVQSWNRGAQRLKGYRAPEIVGESFKVFFQADELENRTPERLLATAERVGTAIYEGWLLRKGGTRFWAHLALGSVEDESGRLVGFSNIARDMTERREMEQALRQSEEHFRRLVDSVQGYGMFMLSPNGAVESWNRGAQSLALYRPPEIVGSPVSRFFPVEEMAKNTPERLVEKARLEGSSGYEGWLVRNGGGVFWGALGLSAIEDDAGQLRGFSVVARDMTERKLSEEALRDAEERTRLLIDSVKDYAVVLLAPDGRVVRWSPAAERLKGFRADEAIGLPISHFFP